MDQVHTALLACNECSGEHLHEVTYAGRLLASTVCSNCGRAVAKDLPGPRSAYLADVEHRVRTRAPLGDDPQGVLERRLSCSRNPAPVAPSRTRWSSGRVTRRRRRTSTAPSPVAAGSAWTAPTARIAASGGLITAVNRSVPSMPRLETVKVQPVVDLDPAALVGDGDLEAAGDRGDLRDRPPGLDLDPPLGERAGQGLAQVLVLGRDRRRQQLDHGHVRPEGREHAGPLGPDRAGPDDHDPLGDLAEQERVVGGDHPGQVDPRGWAAAPGSTRWPRSGCGPPAGPRGGRARRRHSPRWP